MLLSEAIESRRSVRSYSSRPVEREKIEALLEAGILAPSGKNGQPWRFVVAHRDRKLKKRLAELTIYREFVAKADCLIVVLLDKTASYHYVKDCQAAGACIENMLLKALDLGLGACWIGEILNRDLAVKGLLHLGHRYDLMALIAVGYPEKGQDAPPKASLSEKLLEYR